MEVEKESKGKAGEERVNDEGDMLYHCTCSCTCIHVPTFPYVCLSMQSPQVAPLPPEFSLTLAIFSIIGAGLSLLCLMIIVVTYIASK